MGSPLMPAIATPLANRKPGDIDFVVVGENTEGEYWSVGGRIWEGIEREVVYQQSVFSRTGTVRIMKFAFDLARARPRNRVTSATKSNGISITIPYWDQRFKAMAAQYPDIAVDQYHIDILCAHFVRRPTRRTPIANVLPTGSVACIPIIDPCPRYRTLNRIEDARAGAPRIDAGIPG